MASALASLPPPFRFGSEGPRATARKFLERALVLSALVHLSVVSAVRLAENWAGSEASVPERRERTYIVPPPIVPPLPWTFSSAAPPKSEGAIILVPRKPEIELPVISIPGPEPWAPSGEKGSRPGTPTAHTPDTGPPPDDVPAFTHVDTPPVPIDAPKPAYPEWAREADVEGKVLLRVLVGVDGFPMRVDILGGPKGLTEEAQKAVKRWRFSPALSGGIPVRVWVEVPVVFRL